MGLQYNAKRSFDQRPIAQIPTGRVTTYGALAAALGDRVAARWVGHALLHDEHATEWPTHRVIRAGGKLGGYRDDNVDEKRQRLEQDGVTVEDGRVDLDRYGFTDFETDTPLTTLRHEQEALRERLAVGPPGERTPKKPITLVAGVDVSYRGNEAHAAYALIDLSHDAEPTDAPAWSHVVQKTVRFPYISSYLSFRELPVLLELLDEVESIAPAADVLMVDGSGILHPRRMGIASMLGILTERPTIGVTKKRLVGRNEPQDDRAAERGENDTDVVRILEDGEQLGWAVWPRSGTRRPLYISPGHLVDLETSRDVVLQTLAQRRLPEPIYWADRISRAATH